MSEQSDVLVLTNRAESWQEWFSSVFRHRQVLGVLARADFHVRYKRAAFGVGWAVAVPLLQAAVLTFVFSRLIRLSGTANFGAYVLSGIVAWGYFAATLGTSSTSIVDGSNLSDKVWFPRALLPLVPVLANLVGLVVSAVLLVAFLPILGVTPSPRLALLPVALLLLVTFTAALGMVLAALHVYFRDVKYLVQAVLLVWFYLTPIVYPIRLLGGVRNLVYLNPMTGVVTLFRAATVGDVGPWKVPVAVAGVATVVFAVIAVEVQRRRDRLFVDLL